MRAYSGQRGAAKAATPQGGERTLRPGAGPGNQAVQRYLHQMALHRTLAIGRTDDPAEAKADRVAEAITSSASPTTADAGSSAEIRRSPAKGSSPAAASAAVFGGRSGRPLDPADRARFGPRLGMSLDRVRVHDDAATAETADAMGALAFTVGDDIGFAAGQFAPSTASGRKLLAHELAHVASGDGIIRRQAASPSAGQPAADPQAPSAADTPAQASAPPVYWGLNTDSQPRQYYVSVLPPGRSLAEIAAFLYDSQSAIEGLRAANPGVADFVPGGTIVHLAAGAMSASAQASLATSLKTGLLLRTAGIPDSETAAPGAMMHHLTLAGQTYDLLDGQYAALLRGLAWHLSIESDYLKGMCEVYLETRNDHVENNNSLIRGISDWRGGVSVPDESVYTEPMAQAQAIMDALADGEPTVEKILDASRQLRSVGDAYAAGRTAWQTYINGTISGAQATVGALETVRNTCFAIEAGLAGAVVAPVAFAAAGTGLATVGVTGATATVLASTAAVGAGAVVGGGVRGTLDVALPGAQADVPTWDRFKGGFKSGAVAGGVGAAGALVAPLVSGAIAPQLGIAEGVAPTLAQRVALNAATGVVIGAPSGAIAAGIDHAGDFIAGRMSTLDYLKSIGGGAAGGAVGGLAFSLVPIDGLYRSGGSPIPFSGEPVMPRWMMAGPFSPLQPNWSPPPEFNALAAVDLPRLPSGYGWARIGGVWEPINLTGPSAMSLTLARYGVDATGRSNYNILAGDRLVQSSAVTRAPGATYPQGHRGDMPFPTADYFDATGQQWIRGHNIDYADTIDTPGAANSNADPLNYTPEPDWWGVSLRNMLVNRIIRPTGGGYRQMNYYGANPQVTVNGTPIPDGVFFVQTDTAGAAVRAWNVPFTVNGPRTLASLAQFEVPLSAVPAGLLMPSVAAPIAGASGAAGGQASSQQP